MKTTERMELRHIADLIPYAQNARTHSPAQIDALRASLREFGFVSPVLIDDDGNIISGHGRVLAAQAEGLDTVPCVLVEHLTDAQRRAYILADNRLCEMGEWDTKVLENELAALTDADFDVTLVGFSIPEVPEALDLNLAAPDEDEAAHGSSLTKCPKCGFVFSA